MIYKIFKSLFNLFIFKLIIDLKIFIKFCVLCYKKIELLKLIEYFIISTNKIHIYVIYTYEMWKYLNFLMPMIPKNFNQILIKKKKLNFFIFWNTKWNHLILQTLIIYWLNLFITTSFKKFSWSKID